jgi:DNA-binding transcriptional ArsR family regulator
MRIIIRMLRTSSLLDSLISHTRQQVLSAALLQPERRWYLLELARHLGVRPSSLQRELKLLTEAGILKRDRNGNRVYFQADASCPIFTELAQILAKTVGIVDVLKEVLEPVRNRILAAFVYGSVAASAERSSSDIDLMVICGVSLSEIAPMLRNAEKLLTRQVNPTVYTPDDFRRQIARANHFLTNVLRGEPLFVIGGADDLGKLTEGATDKAASDEPRGTRRSTGRRRA